MANTYICIYLHLVFAVKHRQALLRPDIIPRVHKYIAGVCHKVGNDAICIGGIEDHTHILLKFSPKSCLADFVRDVKVASTKFINDNHLCPHLFAWQRGYACFSYSKSQIEKVCRYINMQMEHHKGYTLQEEIRRFLELYDMDYDQKYIFEEPV